MTKAQRRRAKVQGVRYARRLYIRKHGRAGRDRAYRLWLWLRRTRAKQPHNARERRRLRRLSGPAWDRGAWFRTLAHAKRWADAMPKYTIIPATRNPLIIRLLERLLNGKEIAPYWGAAVK